MHNLHYCHSKGLHKSSSTCEDEALFAAFTEQDDQFYGFASEDLGTLAVMAEDFNNDIESEKELDLGTMISRVGSNEDNQPNVLMPNLDDKRN